MSNWLPACFRKPARRPARRLRVEALEDRVVPVGDLYWSVTTLDDTPGLTATGGSGTEADPFLIGSLRAAIEQAELSASADTITFAAEMFEDGDDQTITLNGAHVDTGTDHGEFGRTAFTIGSQITITGPTGDAGLTIERDTADFTNDYRLFTVKSSGYLTLRYLTLLGGSAVGGDGFAGGAGAAGMGGAVFNAGTLVVTNSLLRNNFAAGGDGAGRGETDPSGGGGGVGGDGTITEGGGPNGGTGTFDGEYGGGGSPSGDGGFGGGGGGAGGAGGFGGGAGGSAFPGFGGGAGGLDQASNSYGGGGAGMGGAIFSAGSSFLSVTNSTFTNNYAFGGDGGGDGSGDGGQGGQAFGGAIFMYANPASSAVFASNTIYANIVRGGQPGGHGPDRPSEGGALALVSDGTGGNLGIDLTNNILAGSFNGRQPDDGQENQTDFFAALINGATTANRFWSGTNNLIQRNATGPDAGFTAEGIVSSDDPDVDRLGDNGGPTETYALREDSPAIDAGVGSEFDADQRGLPRTVGIAPDIGAFEVQAAAPALPVVNVLATAPFGNENDFFLRTVQFLVSRNGDTSVPLSVLFTLGGTLSEADATPVISGGTIGGAGTALIFDAGSDSMTLTLTLVDDLHAEGDESAELVLLAGDGYTVLEDFGAATVTSVANDFVVTSTADAGEGSLRQAVRNASSIPGPQEVTFAGEAFDAPATITLTSGHLTLAESGEANETTVTGPAAGLTIRNGGTSRVFRVLSGVHAAMTGLTITGGSPVNTGLVNGDFAEGGGVWNQGTLALTDVTVRDNSTPTSGGGISSSGTLTLSRVTVSGNAARTGAGVKSTGTLTAANSTVSGNTATDGAGGFQVTFGQVTLTGTTITNNRSAFGSGVFVDDEDEPVVFLTNTVVAGNFLGATTTPNDILGPITASYSLIGVVDGGTVTGTTGNITGTLANPVDAMLGALADNGGPTLTHALLAGSPALNVGDTDLSGFDQRGDGFDRVSGARADIGAFEVQVVGPTVSVAPGATISEGLVEPDDFPSFQFTRTGDTSAPLTINVARTGTASDADFFVLNVAGGSYDAVAGTITFAAGAATVFLAVGPTQDGTAAEGAEAITFTVAAGAGYSPDAAASEGTITIAANGFLVTTAADAGEGSLRQAILNANAIREANTITFGEIFGVSAPPTITLNTGELVLTEAGAAALTTIVGPTNGVTVNAADISRAFRVAPGVFADVSRVSFRNGSPDPNGYLPFVGGAVLNEGTLTLTELTVRESAATAGGGIFNERTGTLTLDRVTVTGNIASSYGGIANSGTFTATNSTISGNAAERFGGFGMNDGSATLTGVTITDNSGDFGGGFYLDTEQGATATLTNTIVAGNFLGFSTTPNDVHGVFAASYSLIGVGEGATIAGTTGNLIGTAANPIDPGLGGLGPNGGLTFTHQVLNTSPAVNAGDPATPAGGDQRGELFPRVFGGRADIGAFENGRPTISVVATRATADENDPTNNTLVFTFTRTDDTVGTLDMQFDSSASGLSNSDLISFVVDGDDPTGPGGVVRFAAGSAEVTITVTLGNDVFAEAAETISFSILDNFAYTVGSRSATGTVLANDVVVVTTSDAGEGSLRQAIANANATPGADTVTFDPVAFDEYETITLETGPLVLSGGDGPGDRTTILAPAAGLTVSGGGLSRVFHVLPGSTATLNGLTITGGNATNGVGDFGFGGGVLNEGNLTLTGVTVEENSAGGGGGVSSEGNLTVTDSTIRGNTARDSEGGGLYVTGGSATLAGVTIHGNAAVIGGGVAVVGGSAAFVNVTVSGNRAEGNGGGIFTIAPIELAGSTITDNVSDANDSGGETGGGLHRSSGFDDAVSVTNSIIAGNRRGSTAGTPDDLAASPGLQVTATRTLFGVIADGSFTGSQNLIGVDPRLGPLADNGGPVLSHALLPGSPAVDFGDAAFLPNGVTTDQRGFPRVAGAGLDLGGFEVQPAAAYVVDEATDADDGDTTPGHLSLREAVRLANTDFRDSDITFDPAVFGTPQALTLTSPLVFTEAGGGTVNTITGPAAALTLTQAGTTRLLNVEPGATVRLTDLTLAGGDIRNKSGGAISNGGDLTLKRVLLRDNRTVDNGGAVINTGTLAVIDSRLVNNHADGNGGGIANFGVLKVVNSTIIGNQANGTGGGIYQDGPASATVLNAVIVNNTSDADTSGGEGGGGVTAANGTVTLRNTILTNNTRGPGGPADNVGFTIAVDFSLVGPAPSGAVTGANNVVTAADPGLVFNPDGSYTLLPTSPAFNAGDPNATDLPPTDALGNPRVVAGVVDIGAVELQAVRPTFSSPPAGTFAQNVPGSLALAADGVPAPTIVLIGTLPTGLTFDPATGVLSGTPRQPGTFPLTVTAANGAFTTTQTLVITIDAVPTPVVAVPGAGLPAVVFDPETGEKSTLPVPFTGYDGAVKVAAGDVDGDGVADVIFAAGKGGGPRVAVVSGQTGAVIRDELVYDASFRGGVNVAAGDLDGDGFTDVVVGSGPGGGPHVQVFSGKDGSVLRSFFAYDPELRGGVSVAVADWDGDGRLDLVTGAGAGGAPHVRVFNFADATELAGFFAYDSTLRGGVDVAAGDLGKLGTAVVTGPGPGGTGPQAVKVFLSPDVTAARTLTVFEAAFTGGLSVGIGDVTGDGVTEVLVGAGPTGGTRLVALDPDTGDVLSDEFLAGLGVLGGVEVG